MKLTSIIGALAIVVNLAQGKDFSPKITVNKDPEVSSQLNYFDDSPNILVLRGTKLLLSTDDGATYQNVKDTDDIDIIGFDFDPLNKERAFVFSSGRYHFITSDKGKSWTKFELGEHDDSQQISVDSQPRVSVNAVNKDLILFEYYTCTHDSFFGTCSPNHYYTTNSFKSTNKLPVDANSCKFIKSTPNFKTKLDDSTIICSIDELNSFGHIVESNLKISSDFFKTSGKTVDSHRAKSGSIIDVRVEQTFLVAVIQNDKFNKKSKVSLLVSKDGENFEESDLKIDFAFGVMTFLDSSPSSLFLSVMDYSDLLNQFSLTTLYSSDSSGLRFTKLLENIQGGATQKVQTIDGDWFANIAEDGEDDDREKSLLDLLIGGGLNKNVKSRITLNDGKDWAPLRVNDDDNCKASDGCFLHLLTPTEEDGSGNFVTGPTPGIILAAGNKGTKLETDITKMSTWVSRDGGVSWNFAIDTPCLFSFGDLGNVILAVPYYGRESMSAKRFYFSLDQGKSWVEESLEFPIFPISIITTVDGTGRKFLLTGMFDKTPQNDLDFEFSDILYSIDFSDAFDGKTCGDKDFETVYARADIDKVPVCVYGHKEKFTRRKQDAKCFVNKLFEDIKVYDEPCECTEFDFECAPGFKSSGKGGGLCIPDDIKIAKICKESNKKEITLPDKVLVDGNSCQVKKSLKDFVVEKKFQCSDYDGNDDGSDGKPAHKLISSTAHQFESSLAQYSYIDEGEGYGPENVIVRTHDNRVYVSNDGGVGFTKVPISDHVVAFYTGFVPGQVVLITTTDTIYTSIDGGLTFTRHHAPSKPNRETVALSFHKTDPDQFIWYASERCDDPFNPSCSLTAHITMDGGKTFNVLVDAVTICDYAGPHFEKQYSGNKNMIFCSVVDQDTKRLKLVGSNDFFKSSKVVFDAVVGHAISGKFFVVAAVDVEKNSLAAKVSIDGWLFANADFPHDFNVDSQQAYTVLGSESNAIFLHVTTNNEIEHEYGTILKSNSNGTFYVTSLDKVNRDTRGYVDFDRIDGLEGLVISNTVYKEDGGKKLKTQISHNDGAEWSYMAPPAIDSKGNKYACTGQSLEKCSLNLHGFTERPDYRDTYSSASAIGLIIGVGSVGETLEPYDNSATFVSRDGGITWREIREGVYMWEYGDRGTILVLADAKNPTNKIHYSLDEGETWKEYEFTDEPVSVLDLATVPADTSKKFLIFGHTGDKLRTKSYTIDFEGIYTRQCQLDLDNADKDDFTYWTPSHPKLPDNCLFGHEAKYLRRADGHTDCFIGSAPLATGFKVIRNCTCTRRDYECDYNYVRDVDNTCKLVKGLTPSDHKIDYCRKENAFEYFEPTGYRKVPVSTCVGGKGFDKFHPQPCPGKEQEFNQHYGKEVKGYKLALVILVPLAIFFLATWFVYDRGIRRNGGFKRFGQIRLDEDDFQPIENDQVDKVVNAIVRGGIFLVAGTIATVKTIRKIDGVLFDKISSVIFRRSPGRRNYVQVPDLDEEEELFGNFHDNYEDELDEDPTDLTTGFPDAAEEEPAELNQNEDESSVDSRLFNIDDQSDDETVPPERS